MSRPDAVIIGAGVAGAACAAALARDGLRVRVLESHLPGGGVTGAGMGHIVVLDDNPPEFVLSRHARNLWDEIIPLLPLEAEFSRCGTLWVAADEEEFAGAQKKHARLIAAGLRAHLLDPAQLAEAEPSLRSGLAGGMLVPDDSILYPPLVSQWLLNSSPLIEVRREAATSLKFDAPVRVLASGSQADLLPQLPIRPRKGHLVITDRYPGLLNAEVVELGYLKSAHGSGTESVACNVQPRSTGQLLIGSSRQFEAKTAAVEPHMVRKMLHRAFEFIPALAGCKALRIWTGFRAATPDNLPYIGPWPEDPGLFVAMGHEGLGLTTAPAVAELIADQVAGRQPSIDPGPYLPSRVLQ
jgi:glycine/D-amino acid oxidase-like deaminating enzyme